MHFRSIVVFVTLLLPVTILAAPVPDAPTDVVYLYARAITVGVQPAHIGDYKRLADGRPPHPDAPPPGCSKQDLKDWRKTDNKCKTWDSLHAEFTNIVSPRVVAALTAAEHTLHLNGHIDAHVKSSLHHNAAHDDLFHWTFTFSAPTCGGECTGSCLQGRSGSTGKDLERSSHTAFQCLTQRNVYGHV